MKELSLKLKNIKLLDYANNLILVVFSIVFFLLTLSNLIYLIVLISYLIYLFIKAKKILKLSIILIGIIFLIYLIYRYDDGFRETIIEGKIIEVTNYASYSKYIIRVNNHKVLLYDYDDYNLKVGMIVKVKGSIKDVDTYFTPNAFDYIKYLKNKHIFYALSINKVDIIKSEFTIRKIRYILIDYFDSHYLDTSSSFLKALLVGSTNSLDSDFYESLKDNGILHLFAISGLHVSFFTSLIDKGLNKINIKEKYISIVIFIFLGIYIVITNFSASIVRTSLMYIINYFSKRLKYYLSSLDICSISFIILVIINPLLAFNNGFILSYLVSFTIIMVSPLVKGFKNVYQTFLISLVCSFMTLPLIININYEINILAPFINVLFIGLVTLIMLPLSIIVAFISPLGFVYNYLVNGFTSASIIISKYALLSFRSGKFTPVIIIIYYLIIVMIFICKDRIAKVKRISLLIIYLLFISNINLFKPFGETYFLDLYYGESTVIFSPFKESVVIIDTGDGTSNVLTSFLKSKGVKRIECVIITHNHSDHYGELNNLYKEFKVDKVIISSLDNYNYGMDCIKVKKGDIINLDRFSFRVLNPYIHHEDINDDSIVLLGYVNGFNILLMGDSTKLIEEELISELKNLEIDILKVGHHGSSTSSSAIFLKELKINNSIIMNGRVKKFNFPSNEALNNLKDNNINTYYTKKYKTIWVRSILKKYQFYFLA